MGGPHVESAVLRVLTRRYDVLGRAAPRFSPTRGKYRAVLRRIRLGGGGKEGGYAGGCLAQAAASCALCRGVGWRRGCGEEASAAAEWGGGGGVVRVDSAARAWREGRQQAAMA